MNETCNGVFFTADNHNYYRCLLGGSVVELSLSTTRCLTCGRIIDTLIAIPRQVEVLTVRFVRLPGIRSKVFLPTDTSEQLDTTEDIKYSISVAHSIPDLCSVTNHRLAHGWHLQGGISGFYSHKDNQERWAQAFIRTIGEDK